MRPVKPGQHLERLLAVISPGALLDVLDGDLVAVLAQVPDLSPHAYVGAGGPEAPESLAEAYLAAGRALKAAVALDLAQPIHERDAPLEVALASDRGTGELAERRCFGSVPPRTIERLDLERTLQCLLDAELRIDPAARTLHLHPNTLRHRVARFEQETGLRLSRPRDAALVWWALGHRRASANRHPRGYY
jgi:DNA-binding PucR family transcriptional regulator